MSCPIKGRKQESNDHRIKHCTICQNDYHPSKSQTHTYCTLCAKVIETFHKAKEKQLKELDQTMSKDEITKAALSITNSSTNHKVKCCGKCPGISLQSETHPYNPLELREVPDIDLDSLTTIELDLPDEGKRDTSGKPPRHYFYEEGLCALLPQLHGEACERICWLLEALNNRDIKEAKNSIRYALDSIKELYDGPNLLSDVSYVVKMGAEKYGHANYKKGMKFSYCISSFMGHLLKHAQGQELDEESGYNHLLHCAANMLMLLGYLTDKDLIERFNDIPEMYL